VPPRASTAGADSRFSRCRIPRRRGSSQRSRRRSDSRAGDWRGATAPSRVISACAAAFPTRSTVRWPHAGRRWDDSCRTARRRAGSP